MNLDYNRMMIVKYDSIDKSEDWNRLLFFNLERLVDN